MYFFDETIGYGTNWGSNVLKTFDGGVTWNELLRTGSSSAGDQFHVADSLHLTFDGYQDSLLYTNDGGKSWAPKDLPFSNLYGKHKSYLVNREVSFAWGDSSLYLTTDTGYTWVESLNTNGKRIRFVYFPSDSVGYTMIDLELKKTVDQGNSWTTIYTSPSTIYGGMHSHGNTFAMGGQNGIVLVSTDNGVTWAEESTPSTVFLSKVHVTQNAIYAVGALGTIVKRDTRQCAFFKGKIKLKSAISCDNDTAIYDVFTENGSAPIHFDWITNASLPSTGDTSTVSVTKGIQSFAVSDAENCKDTVSYIVQDLKSALGVDFEPFYIAGNFRTGFTRTSFMEAINIGCQESPAKLYVVLDDLISFVPSLDPYDEAKGDTIIWNIKNSNFDTEKFISTFALNTDVTAQVGDTICVEV